MTALLKARLAEITAAEKPTEVDGSSVEVQFNPTTLRVQIANKTAGGQQAGAQARQRPGTGEMQVSFDLVFDTADEGGDVLERTKTVERFVRPQGTQPGKEAPPRVLFQWGSFLVQGTMESANIDLDLFDASGIPLRAKVAVSIKGQDPRWTYEPASPSRTGSPAGAAPRTPGANGVPAGAPGTQGSNRPPERVVQALPGESLQQLAARNGLDPSAWRALADGLSNPLQLPLGQEVALPGGLSTPTGAAAGAKAQGQDPAQRTAQMSLAASASGTGSASRGMPSAAAPAARRPAAGEAIQQGQAVTVQGGLGAAIAQSKGQDHQQQARQSLRAFGVAARATSEAQERPWGVGVPLRPRFGSGLAAPAPPPNHLALGSPARSSTQASAAAPSVSGAAARSRAPAVGKGCGCRGRRGKAAR